MYFSKSLVFLIVALCSCVNQYGQSRTASDAKRLRTILMPYFVPIEHNEEVLRNDKAIIDLGRQLFYDRRLSGYAKISCNSCHDLNQYGTNGAFYVASIIEGRSFRDVPTVYNSGALSIYNADGGIVTLSEKLKHSFSNSFEMDVQNTTDIIIRLNEVKSYKNLFKNAFPESNESISFENIVEALRVFLTQLKTPAPIDLFIKGNDEVLTKEQIEGGHIFNAKSCYSCHTGSNFGGQMIQKLGITEEWPNQKDLGYYHLTKQSAYKMFFRVAPLRNVDKTGPYFHDGSTNKLWKAIQLMGRHERGLQISEEEALKIHAFLKSLSGEIPKDYIKEPTYISN